MAKYKVCYSGYAYVEADDPDNAIDAYYEEVAYFEEKTVDSVEEVEEFIVEL